ncbi:MAG TPA: flagellar biosynthetic protein FliO [Candidatus Atribacteria bacterium]|nr:flagellar biosynthetic protein FliO [Candidatus Atribacteria bacterium]HPT78035.1 flagellar biosynthetic protein FliO [Candidatus Atribacteria bacterium]
MKPTDIITSVLKLLLALPAVVLLAYISLRMTNKYLYTQNQNKHIQVLERVPLSNKSSLCIAKVLDEYMVLGVSENNLQVIKTLDKQEVEVLMSQADGTDITTALRVNLNKLLKGKLKA